MDAAGGGFGEAAETSVETWGETIGGAGGDDDGFGEAAVEMDAEGALFEAEMFLALSAVAAGGAVDVGFDGDEIAFAEGVDTGAEGFDNTGDFVAEDDGAGGGEFAAEDMGVGAADADRLGADADFTGAGRGEGEIVEDQIAGGAEDDGFHAALFGRG